MTDVCRPLNFIATSRRLYAKRPLDSSFDSPYRTGRHVPLQNGGRGGIMTGVATASDSRNDVSSPYSDETGRASPHLDANTFAPTSAPYSPGLRSMSARNASQGDGFEVQ